MIVIFVLLLLFGAYVSLSPAVSMRLYHYILFFPWKYPSGYWEERDVNGRQPKEVWFTSRNGARLHGWYYTTDPKGQCVILHHGQGSLRYACEFYRAHFGFSWFLGQPLTASSCSVSRNTLDRVYISTGFRFAATRTSLVTCTGMAQCQSTFANATRPLTI